MNPNLIDVHTHTHFSPDADPRATMMRYVEKAKANQVHGVMFTDHVDFDSPIEIFEDQIDYDVYVKELEDVRKHAGIPVLFGVEIGYQSFLNQKYHDLLASRPFDFVICSIHVADGLDFYNGDFFVGKTQHEAYQRYFEVVLDAVRRYDDYDVIGHLDFITRYGGFEDRDYDFMTFQPIIDEILITIIKKQKGIELNTSGLRYGLSNMHPKIEVLKRYKALGGTIVTLGSDAHRVSDLYAGFEEGIDILRDAGFDKVAVFKGRIPTWISI